MPHLIMYVRLFTVVCKSTKMNGVSIRFRTEFAHNAWSKSRFTVLPYLKLLSVLWMSGSSDKFRKRNCEIYTDYSANPVLDVSELFAVIFGIEVCLVAWKCFCWWQYVAMPLLVWEYVDYVALLLPWLLMVSSVRLFCTVRKTWGWLTVFVYLTIHLATLNSGRSTSLSDQDNVWTAVLPPPGH